MWYHSAGPNAVIEAHPSLIIWVTATFQEILVSHEVGALIDHPAPFSHLDGIAAAEMGEQVSRVTAALIEATLEVTVLVEDDL